ncbi:hypothetical protein ACQKWADRAFT_28474 [Trichoderma austrokoningii]
MSSKSFVLVIYPLSWMLVQGVFFAGLTILITVRTGFHQLTSHVEASFLLVDLQSWIRNCSICLTIMNERLQEELLSTLDAQYELLANDTLILISSTITSQAANLCVESSTLAINAVNGLELDQSFNSDNSFVSMSDGEEHEYLTCLGISWAKT